MNILFVGTSSVVPEPHRDTASFVINDSLMVDCGWSAVLGMRQYGVDPLAIRHLLFTHCHHDHCLGLPQLLFYKAHVAKHGGAEQTLDIWGPKEETTEVVERAKSFLRVDKFPTAVGRIRVNELSAGDSCTLGNVKLTTCESIHPVKGLCYRLDGPGESIVISGDTASNEDLVELARGADIMVHEASYGASAPNHNPSGHSGGLEAAKVAAAAGVGLLILVHTTEGRRNEALQAARSVFDQTRFASEGERIYLGA